MRKIIGAVVALALTGTAFSQQGFTITGHLGKVKDPVARVYLSYYANGESRRDSSEVKDGKYQFSGSLADPLLANLMVRVKDSTGTTLRAFNMRKDVYGIFLENAKIEITSEDSFANATVKGSAAHDEYLKLKKMNQALDAETNALSRQYSEYNRAKDEEGMKRVEKEFEKLDAAIKENHKKYVQDNPQSPIALYALGRFAGYDMDATLVDPLFQSLPEATRNSAAGKEMAKKIEVARKTGIGAIAMDFTQNDTLGNPIALTSFRGKYLLIDFWASWCGPCRKENPNVVAAYQKYKGKGFDILGVSLDQPNAKEKWLKAIHDDNLTWTHVSDLKYWKNDVAVQYGIQAIPQNFLLDPQGKIIGKNLRGEDLDKKLAEIFN